MMNVPCLSFKVGKNDDIDHDAVTFSILVACRHVHLIPNSSFSFYHFRRQYACLMHVKVTSFCKQLH